jgi:hypothetical protein
MPCSKEPVCWRSKCQSSGVMLTRSLGSDPIDLKVSRDTTQATNATLSAERPRGSRRPHERGPNCVLLRVLTEV